MHFLLWNGWRRNWQFKPKTPWIILYSSLPTSNFFNFFHHLFNQISEVGFGFIWFIHFFVFLGWLKKLCLNFRFFHWILHLSLHSLSCALYQRCNVVDATCICQQVERKLRGNHPCQKRLLKFWSKMISFLLLTRYLLQSTHSCMVESSFLSYIFCQWCNSFLFEDPMLWSQNFLSITSAFTSENLKSSWGTQRSSLLTVNFVRFFKSCWKKNFLLWNQWWKVIVLLLSKGEKTQFLLDQMYLKENFHYENIYHYIIAGSGVLVFFGVMEEFISFF